MSSKRREIYQISASELRKLRKLAEAKQKAGQREVCGAIASEDGIHIRLVYLPNQTSSSGQFVIGRRSYKSAQDRARRRGEKILGIFHSHPISEAIPSRGDIKKAKAGSLALIYDVCGRQAKLWEIRNVSGRRQAIELHLSIRGHWAP